MAFLSWQRPALMLLATTSTLLLLTSCCVLAVLPVGNRKLAPPKSPSQSLKSAPTTFDALPLPLLASISSCQTLPGALLAVSKASSVAVLDDFLSRFPEEVLYHAGPGGPYCLESWPSVLRLLRQLATLMEVEVDVPSSLLEGVGAGVVVRPGGRCDDEEDGGATRKTINKCERHHFVLWVFRLWFLLAEIDKYNTRRTTDIMRVLTTMLTDHAGNRSKLARIMVELAQRHPSGGFLVHPKMYSIQTLLEDQDSTQLVLAFKKVDEDKPVPNYAERMHSWAGLLHLAGERSSLHQPVLEMVFALVENPASDKFTVAMGFGVLTRVVVELQQAGGGDPRTEYILGRTTTLLETSESRNVLEGACYLAKRVGDSGSEDIVEILTTWLTRTKGILSMDMEETPGVWSVRRQYLISTRS